MAAQPYLPEVQRHDSAAGAWHATDAESVLRTLTADPVRGLSAEEVRVRLAKDGPNRLAEPPRPNRLKQFFAQFANPIVLTLLVAAIIALVHGYGETNASLLSRFGDAIAILLIVILNAILGFYQEIRAEAALDALKKMQTPSARVRRDNKVTSIDASELVAGDVLELEAGDAVPADARLLQTLNLAAEEAALTGESLPSAKDACGAVDVDAPLGDRTTMLFIGTTLVRGKGRAVVVATGPRTELGKVSALMSQTQDRTTPLEQKLDHFGKRILWACLALSVLLFARGMLKGDRTWSELLLEAVSLAVAAIPEGLPAITTITLALGMQRMAKRGAIIRKLAAVETLGAATVICTDKTGTLTQNEMTVREVFAGNNAYRITGVGYEPRGELLNSGGEKIAQSPPALAELLKTIALCNNAILEQRSDGSWRTIGDPTEGALLTLAAKGGIERDSIVSSHKLLRELPFDSDRKRMTIVTLDDTGREVAHTKGSADVLLPLCTHYDTDQGRVPLDDKSRAAILGRAEEMSGRALRVLAVALRELKESGVANDHEVERELTFLGLVGMIDPPRAGVKEAVEACREAHVGAVMITGDHKLTAVAIAQELGLWDDHSMALTGADVDRMQPGELERVIDSVRVFARVTAEQKLRIVRAFKQAGHVVAMTGDGVNDAPALREAHIGVAMGKQGTDVAREAADMILADDNFATIVDAVREGRAIYRNIQKFIFFLLSSNAGLLVAVFTASFVSSLRPLTPLMILWINLVTNGLPALALGVDPPDSTQMQERPRKATSGLLGLREYLGITLVGFVMGGTAIGCYLMPWPDLVAGDESLLQTRALAFSLLALSPLFHAINCRSPTASLAALRPMFPRPLVLAIVLSAAIHLIAILIPSLRTVFQTFPVTPTQWLVLLVLSASIIPVIELLKWLQRTGVVGKDLGPMSRRFPG